jgi:hypothetical protein
MKSFNFSTWVPSLALVLAISSLDSPALGQKRSDRSTTGPKSDPTAPVGPRRSDRTVTESERVRVITKTEFVKVAVRANKGYLSVVAVPAATVTLTQTGVDPKKAPPIKETVRAQDGSLNLINLLPGKYTLLIEHEDFHPYTSELQIDPARPDTLVALNKMVSKYGAIRIGGAPAGAKIYLDDALVSPSSLTVESQSSLLPKVEVGTHRLKVSKDGYADFDKEIEVAPGKPTFISAALDVARVNLNLTAPSGARVYVDNEERASVPSDGNVRLPLAQGKHVIRLAKDGYQEWTKEYFLTLVAGPVNERVDLAPIPNSAEGDWQPSIGGRKWSGQGSGWRFNASGALIKGDQPVLFHTESNREFNTYRDFKLEFDVVFSNGKGVSWVARAKDPRNYYLFEIAGIAEGKPTFHFYICKDGKLEWKDSQPILEAVGKKGDSFHILFEARGGRFDTRMTIASAPTPTPHRVGIFQDNSLTIGGVGFRGKDLNEALLQTFFVLPIQ